MDTSTAVLLTVGLLFAAIAIISLGLLIDRLFRAHRALLSYVDSIHHQIAPDCKCKPHSQHLVSASFADTSKNIE